MSGVRPVLAVIPARGGSKGVPRKNLRPLAGLPLIVHSIRCAQLAPQIDRAIVSTDDAEIASIARGAGADVPFMRPAELADDHARMLPVLQHALAAIEAQEGRSYGSVLLLDPTSPSRSPEDIADAVRMLEQDGDADGVISVSQPSFNPIWLGVVEKGGYMHDLIDSAATFGRRQDLPTVYRINGALYLWRADFLRSTADWRTGRMRMLEIPESRALHIDEPADLRHAEDMIARGDVELPWLRRGPASFRVADRTVGAGGCFVIAEAGVNHNGDVALAHELVDVAADAGADAVKFQTFVPELIAAATARKAAYQEAGTGAGSQLDMLRGLMLPPEAHEALAERAAKRGLLFMSTPFDAPSARLLADMGMPAFKIASGELTHHALLRQIASFGRPVMLSTGMSTLTEVAEAVAAIRAAGDPPLALLHCVSAYPAPADASNLRAMDTMRAQFGVPVGWSDHTTGTTIALAAAARGADIIEKHFTLDRTMEGPDHAASLEPGELKRMIADVRAIASALGDGVKRPCAVEADVAAVARRGLYAARDLPAGAIVAETDLVALRPAEGESPAHVARLVGRTLRRALGRAEPIREADVV